MYYVVVFIIVSLFITCTPKKEMGNKSNDLRNQTQSLQKYTQAPEQNKKINSKADTSFFKGGIIITNNKKYGVYIVEENDNIWIIAKKCEQIYRGNPNYQKKDIGNWSYKINLANYREYFGGVNDELTIGEKILIPLD